MQRSMVLRRRYCSWSKAGGWPPAWPSRRRFRTLVVQLGVRCFDSAFAQVDAAGVRLVAAGPVRAGAGTPGPCPGHVQGLHEGEEHRAVPAPGERGQPDQGPAAVIRQQVDLAGQPAPGASEGLTALCVHTGPAPFRGGPSGQRAGPRLPAGGPGRWWSRRCPPTNVRVWGGGVGACLPRSQDLRPGPVGRPAAMAFVDGLPAAVALGQVRPGNPGPCPVEHTGDHGPMAGPPPAWSAGLRQQHGYALPLSTRQFRRSTMTDSCPEQH
ncbi:hypothetical protein EDD96_7103 [Streptomyces sp. Ag109_G2-6]|nr:hypothetical protein EDD96_7103 [Streptomyces sp. Ag109_G2-6]